MCGESVDDVFEGLDAGGVKCRIHHRLDQVVVVRAVPFKLDFADE
jgi:hypothetical protein